MVDSNNLNAIKYIIRKTPIGHITESIENLKNICGEEIIASSEIQSEIILYEEDHFKQFRVSNSKILISKYSKDAYNYYYDQSQKLKIKVAPLTDQIGLIEIIEYSSSLQKVINEHLNAYKTNYYKDTITTTNVCEQSQSKLIILISSHNINKKSYWSGEWLSLWELTKGQPSWILTGTVRVNTFYYEEGNIQFHLETSFSETIPFNDDDNTLAREVIGKIQSCENKVQTELDQVYNNFSDNYIKPLRRKIPVTGTKMNWNLNQIQLKK